MDNNRSKILFLAAIFILQMIFLYVIPGGRDVPTYDFFPFSSAECTLQEYVYYSFEHLAWCYVFYFMLKEIPSLTTQLKWFLCISIGDAIDYLLTYNSVWYGPISWNVVQTILIIYVISIKNE